MQITRIKPPKYRVGKHILNEYELRNLQVEVAEGKKPSGIKVKDMYGNLSEIRKDGILTEDLHGLDITTMLTFKLFR